VDAGGDQPHRKTCRACMGMTNPADCESGISDLDQIGPWSPCGRVTRAPT
jgi:hypothetical protein